MPDGVNGDGGTENEMVDETQPAGESISGAATGWAAYVSDNAIEIFSAALLAVATLAAAWCAYQATRWGGVQQASFAEASAARVESTRAYNRGWQLVAIDADLFADYVEAVANGNSDLQSFYKDRMFRPEFLPVLGAWLTTDPLNNPDALRNPFVDETYLDELFSEAELLEQEAEAKIQQAAEANQTADEYVLDTVFYAMVLFFAGVSTKFSSKRIKLGLLGLGSVIFLIVVAQLIVTPIQ
jgi:hypothetical protein